MGDNNWVVENLQNALSTWNAKLQEIFQLLLTEPEAFRGGGVWAGILEIHDALKATGLALLVLFFAAGVVRTTTSHEELRRPERALRLFLRFVLAKALVTYGMDVLLALLPSVGAIAAGQLLQVDYRFYGVALIIAFYVLNDWLGKAGFGTAGASRLVPLILVPFALFMAWWLGNTLFLYAMLAIILLVFYNGKKGPALPKYLFYAFYPAHILILYGISLLIK